MYFMAIQSSITSRWNYSDNAFLLGTRKGAMMDR